jgi:hypothetical protein
MGPYFDINQPYYELMMQRRFSDVVDFGVSWLEQEKQSNPTRYSTEPKGTPFYFLGIAAFASHDYQTATFLFDAAVLEDLKHYPANPDTPALLFMRLDNKQKAQAAFEVVNIIAARLDKAVEDYTARKDSDKTLTADHVRQHFLKRVPTEPEVRGLTTALVSFLAEWDYRLKIIDLTQEGSRTAFFTHLFTGCLLFESLLKAVPGPDRPTEKTLGPILRLGDPIATALGITRKLDTSRDEFEDVVKSAKPLQPILETIECAVQSRNTLGHKLGWLTTSLDAEKYDLLAKNIAASCVHVISTFYR